MMINHVWTVLCADSSIDSETNNVSLFHILEQLVVFCSEDPSPEEMVIPVPFEVFSLWVRKDPEKPVHGKGRVFYCFPNDSCSKPAEFDIDLDKTVLLRTRVRSQGIKVRKPGMYTFYIELQNEGETEWTRVATLPLLIEFKDPLSEKQQPSDE